jgi:hypothetical protein
MRWNTWMLGPVAAVLLAGCGGGRDRNNASSTAGGGPETGTATDTGAMTATDTSSMTPGAATDTGPAATGTDTSRQKAGGTASDSAKNQSQSGVTNDTGKSTLGPKVTKTRPDQNQPVTSKGDTVSNSGDTAASTPK